MIRHFTAESFKKLQYRRVLRELKSSDDPDVLKQGKLLERKGWLSVFLGDWTEQYENYYVEAQFDHNSEMFYVEHASCLGGGTNRMYFPRAWGAWYVRRYYSGILKEQDIHSPHLYFTESLRHEDLEGTVIDCGAAEGIFLLDIINRAKKVYCFEPDPLWQEPLAHTIEPFYSKVTFEKKFIGDSRNDEKREISLDEYFDEEFPTDVKMIKLDIEGAEQKALRGMRKLLELNPAAILLVCAYHSQGAEIEIRDIMEPLGYTVVPRDNYMLVALGENAKYPYIRHGVLEIRHG